MDAKVMISNSNWTRLLSTSSSLYTIV
uniref:Uncharacterized protein n=1 Tax=Arundo donax TaxID=35708 RepID=A0A0A8YCP6_ARUDO